MSEPATSEAPVTPELAPVRAGEDLAWDRIEAYLRAHMPVPLEGRMEVLQFPGGSANLTYMLRFGEDEFVLRRPPFGRIAPGAHDMKREHKVLSRLWKYFDRAPRSYLLCEDHDVAGADFFVMERRKGVVIYETIPDAMKHHDNVVHRVSFALIDAMADFHLLNPEECELGDLGRPEGFVKRQVEGWNKRWQLAKLEDSALFDETYDRLARSMPESPATAFVHNDLKLDNCQFDPENPDRVKSFFDWDMTTLGDPLIDLGTLLGYWPNPGDKVSRSSRAGLEDLGLPTREEIAGRYSQRTGVPLEKIAWYEAFALWKTAVVIQQLYTRFVRGETKDERMADKAPRIALLTELAAEVLDDAGY